MSLIRKTTLTAIALVLSSGWTVPAMLSAREWMRYSRQSLGPESEALPLDSFPHAQASETLLTVAAIWLALAICFWVVFVLRRGWDTRER